MMRAAILELANALVMSLKRIITGNHAISLHNNHGESTQWSGRCEVSTRVDVTQPHVRPSYPAVDNIFQCSVQSTVR